MLNDKSIAELHPEVIITLNLFSAHPLQDRQYAIYHTFIVHRLFLPTAVWALIYSPWMPCYISPYVIYNIHGMRYIVEVLSHVKDGLTSKRPLTLKQYRLLLYHQAIMQYIT